MDSMRTLSRVPVLFSFPLAVCVSILTAGGGGLVCAQDDLELPERAVVGLSLRDQEVRPNAVIRPPASPTGDSSRQGISKLGAGHVSWRLFKPDANGVSEVAGDAVTPPVLSTTAVELIRGIILLPGETALELTGTKFEVIGQRDEETRGKMHGAHAEALQRKIENYTNSVPVAPAFEGVRDHGALSPQSTLVALESLLGNEADDRAEQGIAEAVILGFATAGKKVHDVIVVRDATVPGIFKVVVLGAKPEQGTG